MKGLRLVLIGCLWFSAIGTATSAETPTSCADLTRAHHDAPCSFDFSRYRTKDPRLDAIEAKGVTNSGLFTGAIHEVRSAAEVTGLKGKVRPGDQVVLSDGTWTDATISLEAHGTTEKPILVRPRTPGGVVFKGKSSVRVFGSHIVVHGLSFRDGTVERDNFVILRLGGGKQKPCDDCIVNRVTIDNYNSQPDGYTHIKIIDIVLQGRNITVANSKITGKQNVGLVVRANHPIEDQCPSTSTDCFQRLLFRNNIVSGYSKGVRVRASEEGKHKVIELGGSRVATAHAYSVIEDNVFENADGGTNTISIKTSDVIIRNNRFLNNLGTVNVRSANRVLIQNNLFDGTSRDGMGGVLIQGRAHWIVGNIFKGLDSPLNNFHAPIALTTGRDEELRDGANDYARVKELVIIGNRFENSIYPPVYLGIFPKAEVGRTLAPTQIYVLDNVFSFPAGKRKQPADSFNEPLRYISGGPHNSQVFLRGNSLR